MPDGIGNGKLAYQIGLEFDGKQALNGADNLLDQTNQKTKELAQSFDSTSKALQKIINKTKQHARDILDSTRQTSESVRNLWESDTISSSEAIDKLKQKIVELETSLAKNKSKGGGTFYDQDAADRDAKELNNLKQVLSSINNDISQLQKATGSSIKKATKDASNMTRTVLRETIETANEVKKQNIGKELQAQFETGSKSANEALASIREKIAEYQNAISTGRNSKGGFLSKDQVDQYQSQLKTLYDAERNIENNIVTDIRQAWRTNQATVGESVNAMVKKIGQLKTAIAESDNPQQKANLTKILAQVQREYDSLQRTVQKTANQSTESYDSAYEQLLNKTRSTVVEMESEFKDAAQNLQRNTQNAVSQMNRSFEQAAQSSKEVTDALNPPEVKDFGETIKQNIVYAGLYLSGIRALAGGFTDLVRSVIDVNYNVINNQRLMGDYSDKLRDTLNESATSIAESTGIQLTDAQEIQGAWIRINDKYAESAELLNKISKATAEFMNVGEIKNADEAVKLVNASMLQFRMSANEGIKTLNKWAYMADKTAMGTADEFGESASKIGGYMTNINGNMNDAIVLTSMLGDRLAKDGKEAGNSLKTIMSYLHRSKTVKLFDEIAKSANDSSLSMKTASGQFKDFKESMATASKAYHKALQEGNDDLARDIRETLGATRQGDVATTLLENWSKESGKYYKMVNDSVSGEKSYLEEQNDQLMKTFKSQWSNLQTSVLGLLTDLGNAGVLDSLSGFMKGLTGVADAFRQLNPDAQRFLVTMAGFGVLTTVTKKLAEVTGATQTYNNYLKFGDKVQQEFIQNTSDEIQSMTGFVNEYKNTLDLTFDEATQLGSIANEHNKLNKAFQDGAINGEQYAQGLEGIKKAYGNVALSYKDASGNIKQLSLNQLQEKLSVDKDTASTIANTTAEKANAEAKKETAEASSEIAKSSVKENINSSFNAMKLTALDAISKIKTAFIGMLPMIGISAAIAGIGLIVEKIKDLGNETEKTKSEFKEAKNKLEELTNAQKKLESKKQEQGGLSTADSAKLEAVKTELEYQKKITDEKKKQAEYDKVFGANSVERIFKGKGVYNQAKQTTNALKQSREQLEANLKTLKSLNRQAEKSPNSFAGVTQVGDAAEAQAKRVKSYAKAVDDNVTKLQNYRAQLQKNLESDELDSDSKAKIRQRLSEVNDELDKARTAQNEYANATGNSINADQNKIEASNRLQQALQDQADALGTVNERLDPLNTLWKEYNDNGYISVDTASQLLAKDGSLAQYLTKVGNQYVLNNEALEAYNSASKDQTDTIDEMIEAAHGQYTALDILSDKYKETLGNVNEFLSQSSENFSLNSFNKLSTQLSDINSKMSDGKINITDYANSLKEITNNADFSKINNDLEKVKGKTGEAKKSAQEYNREIESQQSMYTALATSVGSYMAQLVNGFNQGSVSATDFFSSLASCDQTLLEMNTKANELHQNSSGMWVDAAGKADTFANKLQNTVDQTYAAAEAAKFLSDNYDILNQASQIAAEGQVGNAEWANIQSTAQYQSMLNSFSDTMAQLHATNIDAYNKIAEEVASANNSNVQATFNGAGQIQKGVQLSAQATSAGATAMVDLAQNAMVRSFNGAAKVVSAFANLIKGFDLDISAIPKQGKKHKLGDITVLGIPLGGIYVPDFSIKVKGGGKGKNSTKNQLSSLSSGLKTLSKGLSGYGAKAKLNLASFKPQQIKSNYSPAARNSGSTPRSSSGSSGSKSSGSSPSRSSSSGSKSSGRSSKSSSSSAEDAAKQRERDLESAHDDAKSAREALKDAQEYAEKTKELQEETAEYDADKSKEIQKYTDKANKAVKDAQNEVNKANAAEKAGNADAAEKAKKAAQEYRDIGKEAQEAAQKIRDNVKEIYEAIQKYREDFANNSVDLYKDIIDALKDEYQKLYDARKKQIQDEIDAINGDDTASKEKQLDELKRQYELWQSDNSTLGKSKQKEISDQIIELDKDIKVGKLEATIDEDSDTYDPILKELDEKMKEKNLADQARSMIQENQLNDIEKLLEEFKPDYENISYLMGNTIGEIIAKQVTLALANFQDLKSNDITSKGGKRTNVANESKTVTDVYTFATGGYVGNSEGLAYIDTKERVLTARQTEAFDKLVYDVLPSLSHNLVTNNVANTNNSDSHNTVFNKELVSVHVNKVENNTETDIKQMEQNLNTLVKKSLNKSGINTKR